MLLDHFNSPLADRRHWEGFHHAWATLLALDLMSRLPAGWFAEPNIRFGVEVDVAVMDKDNVVFDTTSKPGEPTPLPSVMTIDFPFTTDIVEVKVFRNEGGPELAGVIELVSPANKDRPETRNAFVTKCAGFLQDAIGLVIVDMVTKRHANLHVELIERFHESSPNWADHHLYVSAYGAKPNGDDTKLEVWFEALELGESLPVVPLCLKHGPRIAVDLPGTYTELCQRMRIVPPSNN